MGWLLDGEEIVSASGFVNLSGEGEVFEVLNVEEIVELVLTEGQDKPDSDEDGHDEPHIVQTSIGQAKEYAWKLQEFVEYYPDSFPPHLVSAVNDIRGKLNAMQLTSLLSLLLKLPRSPQIVVALRLELKQHGRESVKHSMPLNLQPPCNECKLSTKRPQPTYLEAS
jgi:hypothetical protein